MSNPYNKNSAIGRAYDALKKTGAPISVTSLASLTGDSYHTLYGAIRKDAVGAIELITVNGMRSAALVETVLTKEHGDAIRDAMQGKKGMTVAEIAKQSGVPAPLVSEFIGQQTEFENIDTTPASSPANYRYEWTGPIRIEVAPSSETKADDEMIARLEQALDGEPKPVVETEADVAPIETHETPAPKGIVGNGKAVESAYMVVVSGETRLYKTESEAYEIGSHEAGKQAAVFVYEVVGVSQIKYTPTVVEHDLASLCQ